MSDNVSGHPRIEPNLHALIFSWCCSCCFLQNTPSASYKWKGGVLAPNGKIYCCPYWYTEVLEIDPVEQTTREIETGITNTPWGYGGCCLAPDGVIYCLPLSRTDILAITPLGVVPKIPTGRYLSAYYNKF